MAVCDTFRGKTIPVVPVKSGILWEQLQEDIHPRDERERYQDFQKWKVHSPPRYGKRNPPIALVSRQK